MKHSFTIRPQAQRDLREIWRYTRKTWSAEQANRYIGQLNAALAERPDIGRPADDISPGLRRRGAERHVIYFRVIDKRVIIVRVLHDRMNPSAHLADNDS